MFLGGFQVFEQNPGPFVVDFDVIPFGKDPDGFRLVRHRSKGGQVKLQRRGVNGAALLAGLREGYLDAVREGLSRLDLGRPSGLDIDRGTGFVRDNESAGEHGSPEQAAVEERRHRWVSAPVCDSCSVVDGCVSRGLGSEVLVDVLAVHKGVRRVLGRGWRGVGRNEVGWGDTQSEDRGSGQSPYASVVRQGVVEGGQLRTCPLVAKGGGGRANGQRVGGDRH